MISFVISLCEIKISYEALFANPFFSNIFLLRIENIYYCCIVKLTYHIRGYASTEEKRILFRYEPEEYYTNNETENDPGYEKDMSICFESIFKGH